MSDNFYFNKTNTFVVGTLNFHITEDKLYNEYTTITSRPCPRHTKERNIATIKPELSKDQGDLVTVSYNELSRGKV